MGTVFAVTLGVILGGIALFLIRGWFYGRIQRSTKRLNEYWREYLGTPLHVSIHLAAEDYLQKKYGDNFQSDVAGWAMQRGLLVSPEKRIIKLRELAKANEEKKDKDEEMQLHYTHFMAVRQWAAEVGLESAFDKWVDECLVKLQENESENHE